MQGFLGVRLDPKDNISPKPQNHKLGAVFFFPGLTPPTPLAYTFSDQLGDKLKLSFCVGEALASRFFCFV
jgi:hypothetical protein